MIKSLPTEIKLPNYPINISFRNKNEKEAAFGFGELTMHTFSVSITDTNPEFNKYLYSTFIIYALASAYDINVSKHKAHTLGLYLYHILEFNNFNNIFYKFSRKKEFDNFSISVPSFKLDVASHKDNEKPLGIITISERKILIHSESISKLKNVILMHELVEWANTMYNLNFKHVEIQVLGEGFAYVIKENKFTT
jgi:hypothetical protein